MQNSIVAAILLVSGCATKYQPVGFTGGYSEAQLDANTYRISFRGNGFTPRDRVDIYLLTDAQNLQRRRATIILSSSTAAPMHSSSYSRLPELSIPAQQQQRQLTETQPLD